MKKPFSSLAAVLLFVVALAHVWCLATGAQVTIADDIIPMWVSGVGAVVAGGLAVMLWLEARK